MKLSNSVYEKLRWLTWIVLPATATLISALDATWGWGLPVDAILSSFVAVETFIGVVLGISKYSYDNASSAHKKTPKVNDLSITSKTKKTKKNK